MNLLNIFQKNKKKASELEDLTELNLFKEDIQSDSFLNKVKALKDINKKFQNEKNLLHIACEYYELELARTVIDLGINIEEKDKYGNTPLWTAVLNAKGNYELVDLLLSFNANPNSVNGANTTPLKFAEKIDDEILLTKLRATTTANRGHDLWLYFISFKSIFHVEILS